MKRPIIVGWLVPIEKRDKKKYKSDDENDFPLEYDPIETLSDGNSKRIIKSSKWRTVINQVKVTWFDMIIGILLVSAFLILL